jgi:hypothetical protein
MKQFISPRSFGFVLQGTVLVFEANFKLIITVARIQAVHHIGLQDIIFRIGGLQAKDVIIGTNSNIAHYVGNLIVLLTIA